MATYQIAVTFLPQTDPDVATAFYGTTLGWEIRQEVESNGMKWITVGPENQPDVSLVLYPPNADPRLTDAQRTAVAEMMQAGTFGNVQLVVDSVEAAFVELKGKGVKIAQELTEQPWGAQDFVVEDPFGNQLRIKSVDQPRDEPRG